MSGLLVALVVALAALSSGCEGTAHAAAPPAPQVVVIDRPGPAAPPQPQPRPEPPPVWQRRRRRSRRNKPELSEAELARQAARRAMVAEQSRSIVEAVKPELEPLRDIPELVVDGPTIVEAKPAAAPSLLDDDDDDDDDDGDDDDGAPTAGAPEEFQVPGEQDARESLASELVKALEDYGPRYPRDLVQAFQRRLGLVPDGIYGPGTAGAVKYYMPHREPPPHYLKTAVKYRPYTPED